MGIALGKALIGLVAAGAAAVGVYSMAGSGTPQLPRLTDNPQPIEGLAVFPGAEGFGTRTRAGRGGNVLIVDSLADAGRGTLREALSQDGPRTIVFHVGGVIQLKSHLFIDRPFVTIAGQTAPGDGIVLKDFGIVITTNDVLLQHVRVRPGNQGAVRVDHNDAIAILGPTGAPGGAYNVVIDHVSASWGEDEVISTWFSPHDITISWSIVSEALSRSRHPKETHSAAVLIGDGTTRTSLHHNLMAHNDIRNPLIASGGMHDVVNNVVYNWGALSTEIVENAPTEVNVIGNYYRAGRSSVSPYPVFIEAFSPAGNPRVFVAGNMHYGHEPPANAWDMVQYRLEGKGGGGKVSRLRSVQDRADRREHCDGRARCRPDRCRRDASPPRCRRCASRKRSAVRHRPYHRHAGRRRRLSRVWRWRRANRYRSRRHARRLGTCDEAGSGVAG